MQRHHTEPKSLLSSSHRLRDETHKTRQETALDTSRSIHITNRRDQHTYATANIDESGDYDDAMSEWTVHVLSKNHLLSCPLETISSLEVKVGHKYSCSFDMNRADVMVRVYSVPRQEEKSFSLTIGSKIVILGRCRGWPEARTPEESEGEEFCGSLEILLQSLEFEYLSGVELIFGCIVLKSSVLNNETMKMQNGARRETLPTNWETFE